MSAPSTPETPARTVDPDAYVSAAERFGLDPATARKAAANLAEGTVMLLVVSGKLRSGKDTVAPMIFDALGVTRREHHYFAQPLKDELDEIIAVLRAEADAVGGALTPFARLRIAGVLARRFDMPLLHAQFFTGPLLTEVVADRAVHARSRTAAVRRALQYLGTDVRRAQDPEYWVKLALREVLRALADGFSVYFTDARFPNEVEAGAGAGGFTLRLDITEETQRQRLAAEGLTQDPAAVGHVSETALDDYEHFDLRVSNDGELADTLAAVLTALAGREPARRAA